MSQTALMAMIDARWTAASLTSSIATLYAGGTVTMRVYKPRSSGGSPETTELPRAEFMVQNPAPTKTRNSKIRQSVAIIHVWGTTSANVASYLTSIYNAYVNQESNLTLSGGDVLDIDDGGQYSVKEDDAVYFGQQILLIRHRVNQP